VNITEVKRVMLRTHTSALALNERASGLMVQSAPGVGKTEAAFQYVEQLAIMLGEPVGIVQFMLATIQSADVRGFGLPIKAADGGQVPDFIFSRPPWAPVKTNTWVCEPTGNPLAPVKWYEEGEWTGPLPRAGVLFLDEFGQADEDVKKPAAELIYKGNVGTHRLPKGWRVIAATNRVSDRSGVMRELMFIVNRRCLLNVQPVLGPWLEWAALHNVHYMSVSFARLNPGVVFHEDVPEGTDPFCTPRSLVMMDRDLRAIRSDTERAADKMPLDEVSREVCQGWVGAATMGQYFTHLKYSEELPDPADIATDYRTAKVPAKQDAQMVTAFMLSHHVKPDSSESFMRYIGRLHKEMQHLAVRTITGNPVRAAFFTVTDAYRQWLMANKDTFIASRS